LGLLNLLLNCGLIPTANLCHVLTVPLLAFIKIDLYFIQILLNFQLVVRLPPLDIIETYCHAHFVVSSSSANSVPKSIIIFGIEQNDKVELNVNTPCQKIRSQDYFLLVDLVHEFNA
jgi:hypothetical protein